MPGVITIASVVPVYLWVSDFPEKAKWLKPDELALVKERLQADRAEEFDDKTTLAETLAPFKDWRVWAMSTLYMYPIAGHYAMAFFTPSILNDFGFSVALSQILNTPPYICAAFFSIGTGLWADKVHLRSPFMVGHALVVIVGFLLMGWGPNTGAKLTGVFVAITGNQCLVPTILTFMSNNVVSVKHRKVAIALQIVFGAVGGIVGSLIFRAQDAPLYRPGMYAAFTLMVLLLINLAGIVAYFWRQNKRAEEEGLIIDGVEGFRYTL